MPRHRARRWSARGRARPAGTLEGVMTRTVSSIVATLREALAPAPGQRVYGVVDAATCVDLAYEAKVQYGKEIRSLFLPEVQAGLWDVAPYLVPIDVESGYLENWARRWGTNAGVLLVTAADDEALYGHLRKVFVVEDEEGQEYFFRFYDPRVLRAFLPTCTAEQFDEFFGLVDAFLVESAAGDALLRYRCDEGKLAQTTKDLLPGKPTSENTAE
jgi:hypothetical protein